jgi:hypothetical protein
LDISRKARSEVGWIAARPLLGGKLAKRPLREMADRFRMLIVPVEGSTSLRVISVGAVVFFELGEMARLRDLKERLCSGN